MLPIASGAEVRAYLRRLIRAHPRMLALVVVLHVSAAVAGLVTPRLLGDLVEKTSAGTTTATVDRVALTITGVIVVVSVLVRYARLASARLGEQVLATLREEFVDRVLAVPPSTVERAGTGDLLTRASRDVEGTSSTVRFALPEVIVGVLQVLLTLGAVALLSPLLLLPALIAVPVLWSSSVWYFRRAPAGYLASSAAFAQLTDGLAETVEGARTVDVLRLRRRRVRRTQAHLRGVYGTNMYTLKLRTVFFPLTEFGYVLPGVVTLVAGGWYVMEGWATVGQVTAAVLYFVALIDPLDRVLSWFDQLQVGLASLARIVGVQSVPVPAADAPPAFTDERIVARGVRFSYVDGRDVLHGVDLEIRPGERLAVVGPSGAGKSTLGRLLAGIYTPGDGAVTVGGVPLADLPLASLRQHVALVTQEHHVFLGTVRDNLVLARPSASVAELRRALATVDALDWVDALPDGLDTVLGEPPLSPAQAQQLALARLVLADPHTLVLDEATSLIDPRAARHLERSLAGALEGRTVIAIAHRLFSAHDADRVAVVEDGRITELGSHDELVAAGGAYAALWRSWHGTDRQPTASP
ncbi:ABC transporter ATP-binding protein [Dactylosporangium siamense]|uniref:Multidrug ABC transporter ATP-binding protein n=1 Tax=Dactylosporangium siamense TaxID=685454 RepID=A0A919PJS3_9ACTN|nr:ABC transporter ATP-binding protein [Dactylosporangium siamense]GIG43263.1 multidrug ABC transporter ATP-binding protein [Dactylosporangium siamense]